MWRDSRRFISSTPIESVRGRAAPPPGTAQVRGTVFPPRRAGNRRVGAPSTFVQAACNDRRTAAAPRPRRAPPALPVARRHQLVAAAQVAQRERRGPARALHHLDAPPARHQVQPHPRDVLARRLDQQQLGPLRAQPARLVAQPPPAHRAHRAADALGRRPAHRLGQRRRRVQADHEVQAAAREQVEVRQRADAAVHVAPPADADRVVEARDRAGRGDRLADRGARGRVLAAEDRPAAVAVVGGDRPEARMVRPVAVDEGRHEVADRLRRDEPARQPARDHRRGRMRPRVAQRAQRHPPRARARSAAARASACSWSPDRRSATSSSFSRPPILAASAATRPSTSSTSSSVRPDE